MTSSVRYINRQTKSVLFFFEAPQRRKSISLTKHFSLLVKFAPEKKIFRTFGIAAILFIIS